jgi:hypothetical protein
MKPGLFSEPGIEDAEPVETPTIGLGPQSRALVTRAEHLRSGGRVSDGRVDIPTHGGKFGD